MSRYGDVAIQATYMSQEGVCPIKAWDIAANNEFNGRTASIKKGCPKNAFLGLAEEGHIVGVPEGTYTKSELNKLYALKAFDSLKSNGEICENVKTLWALACDSETKVHNGQMDVVLSLWSRGLLK